MGKIENRDSGAVEKGEIASSLRSSQRHKVRFQVIASDSKNRAAISMRHYGVFQQPHSHLLMAGDSTQKR